MAVLEGGEKNGRFGFIPEYKLQGGIFVAGLAGTTRSESKHSSFCDPKLQIKTG
jgi:hypothetical protein